MNSILKDCEKEPCPVAPFIPVCSPSLCEQKSKCLQDRTDVNTICENDENQEDKSISMVDTEKDICPIGLVKNFADNACTGELLV